MKVPGGTPEASPPFVVYGELLNIFQPASHWGHSPAAYQTPSAI